MTPENAKLIDIDLDKGGRRNAMIAHEEAANLTDVPKVRQQGTRLGNWLTREHSKELLTAPTVRPEGANVITRSLLFWSAARAVDGSSRLSTSKTFSSCMEIGSST